MKKIIMLIVSTFIISSVNAQWFLGGNVGINATIGEAAGAPAIPNTKKDRDYLVGLAIAPKFGYYFNEKVAAGVELSFGLTIASTTKIVYDPFYGSYYPTKYEGMLFNWRFAPFFRYAVFTHKKFSLMLEGTIGIGGEHSNLSSNNLQDYSMIGIGVLNIVPVLSYKLTDRLQLEAVLNFLNLGYNIDIDLVPDGSWKAKHLQHDLNIGFNAKSIFVMSQLTIGVIYKFK
ncbi:MAG: hypothetical protein FWC34_06745 [Bacteroidetes bacterium]|nr:hypothetical protein [Bacteroidota bacterium]MCL2303615.1 hypothetical protein [Lentimicrobiaceae bacterium]